MLRFVGAKGLDRLAERGVGGAEALGLSLVVLVDDLLDGDRAGHRRALAEERRCRAERVTSDMPQRMQQGRPHLAPPYQRLEGGEMAFFLRRHAADLIAGAAAPDDCELAVI